MSKLISVKLKHRGLDIGKYTKNILKKDLTQVATTYAEKGLQALKQSTPADTGITANSWYYVIENQDGVLRISWLNSNVVKGICIAIIIRYGHGTGTGGWVEGRDYITPAMTPVFEEMANDCWKEVIGE